MHIKKWTSLIATAIVLTTFASCESIMNAKTTFESEQHEFMQYLSTFNKQITSLDEFLRRKQIWTAVDDLIKSNSDPLVELRHNKFSDRTQEEIQAHRGLLPRQDTGEHHGRRLTSPLIEGLLSRNSGKTEIEIDWVAKGVVNTQVKDQGSCGACYAFAGIAALESAYAIKHGKLLSLSEQQIIDCSSYYGNQGCRGGLMENLYQYAFYNEIQLEKNYPWTGIQGTCQFNRTEEVQQPPVKVKKVKIETDMSIREMLEYGPVAVGISSTSFLFVYYYSGIITSWNCGVQTDHAVLVVGYGHEQGVPYYLIKNSWGRNWGINGYAKIGAPEIPQEEGICGIHLYTIQPEVL